MALKPGKYTSQYNISDTILDRVKQNDVETFRGSGTDYSELGTSIIYIASVPLKRVVSLKAFIETAKYNITNVINNYYKILYKLCLKGIFIKNI